MEHGTTGACGPGLGAKIGRESRPSRIRLETISTKQKERLCLFCGEPGKRNREHIVAKWIGRSLTPSPIPGTVVRFRHQFANPEAGIEMVEKTAGGPAYYTRAFCERCNGGWMSELESAVKPILGSMLHGQPRLIDAASMQTLAFWASKTIFAFQAAESAQTTFARPEDFRALFEDRQALPESQVWLGAESAGDPLHYRAHSARLRGSGPEAIDGFGATLVIGHAAFYFLHGFAAPIGLRLKASMSGALREIHPRHRGDFAWPSKDLLGPDLQHGLAEQVIANSNLPRVREPR